VVRVHSQQQPALFLFGVLVVWDVQGVGIGKRVNLNPPVGEAGKHRNQLM